jgi:large subunit ribosomal protein L21
MYAVFESGGKQYKVVPGEVVRLEKLNLEKGATVEFDKVLAISKDEEIQVGKPVVENARVVGTVVENGKAKKVIVFKYKRKKQYRVKRGHRQPYTAVQISEIIA